MLNLEYAPGANPSRAPVHTHKFVASLLERHAEALAITDPEGVKHALNTWLPIFWWYASQPCVVPTWGTNEPRDHNLSQAGWIAGLLMASAVSSRLNRVAALLTGAAVILTTASIVVSLL